MSRLLQGKKGGKMEGRQPGGKEKNGRDSEWVSERGTGNIVGEKRAIRGKDGDTLQIEVGRTRIDDKW